MVVRYEIEDRDDSNCVLTLGMFDGFHCGHRALLEELKRIASEKKLPSVVVTFWPHPKKVLGFEEDLKILTTLDEKISLISNSGVDELLVMKFTPELSRMSPSTFINEVLIKKIRTKFLLMGYNHKFGSGNYRNEEYEQIARECGLEVERFVKVEIDNGKYSCSSSEVRQALADGDIEKANRILGYAYFLNGKVVHGDAIGRKIGFPTANIEVNEKMKMLPRDGVYSCSAKIGGRNYGAVANVGIRPTMKGNERRIEVYIIDFNKDIYGEQIEVAFNERLRDEHKFNTIEELRSAIMSDVNRTKSRGKTFAVL